MKIAGKKLRTDRLMVLIACSLVCILAIVFIIRGVHALFKDPYADYKVYDTKEKTYGDVQQDNEEFENDAFLSFTYPEFEGEEELNTVIKKYKDATTQTASKEKEQITSVDYSSSIVFDRFVNIRFHKRIYNQEGKQNSDKKTWILYDKKAKKQLTVDDVLRRNYPVILKELASKQGWKEEIEKTFDALSMNETEIQLHLDDSHVLSIPYDTYKTYMKLKDTHIPSLYQKDAIQAKAQPKVDPNQKMIAFTFDDGPSMYTSEIMDLFEQYGGRATFFMLGQNVESHKDVVKEMQQRGFELGNHSWDHSMRLAASKNNYMSVEDAAEEVYKTQDAIYAICGNEPKWLRPPYGAVNDNLLEANYLGYAFWDIDTEDWSSKNASSIANITFKRAKSGNVVVLLHDIYEPSMESLKIILPKLKEEGYQFVTYSTLMEYEQEYLLNLDAGYGVPKEYANGH